MRNALVNWLTRKAKDADNIVLITESWVLSS